MEWLNKLKPGLPKIWLLLAAGLMWTGVGFFLISLALEWILAPDVTRSWIYWLPGLVLAGLIFLFGFSRLSRKNSRRITDLEAERPCIFAFQEWHSYPLVLFMIGLGITLRKFTPIPKPLLGILYLGIGGGLGLASIYYYLEILHYQSNQK
jgi:FtsH-binding integral membrane protein